jgi:hypothetical protein
MASNRKPATGTTAPARKPRRERRPIPDRDPVRALHDRIRDTGFRFSHDHVITVTDDDRRSRRSFSVTMDVIITGGASWMDMPESTGGGWSYSVADDGLVIATRFRNTYHVPGQPDAVRFVAHTGHDPDRLHALQAFRGALFDFLETGGDIRNLEMRAEGNGDCELRCDLVGHELGCDITLDIGAGE